VTVMLATESKVRGFKTCRKRWILREINIHSTTSSRGQVKPSVPLRKILRHGKNPCSMKEILASKIHGHFSPKFSLLCY
jgi:hypothetical protein